MNNRRWEGKLRRLDESVDVFIYSEDGERRASIFRELNGNWVGADLVQKRPSDGRYDIFVARFHDQSEVLIEWWFNEGILNVSYREMSFSGWQAPARLTEAEDNEGDDK